MGATLPDEYDLSIMQYAEPALGVQMGEGVLKHHPRSVCEGRDIPCCIHSPSNHHMSEWPMNWRSDTGVMERMCPHGTGHPDPDHMTYVRSLTPEHDCIRETIRAMGKTPSRNPFCGPASFFLDEDEDCPHPHLEWQGTHGCDLCCTPPNGRR